VRHGRKKDGRCGLWASDKILFAEKKTCGNGAKKPALNVRFAPRKRPFAAMPLRTLWAISDVFALRENNELFHVEYFHVE
jgi:hypothetical protein